jgi:hypothetical protein
MGRAYEVVTGFATAPGAVFTALTMSAGDSLTVKNEDLSKKAQLLEAWAFNQVAGVLRVRSTKLHDNVQGIRWTVLANLVFYLQPLGYPQRVYPQDPLIVELTGSAVGGQIETAGLMLYYEDLPGAAQRLASTDDIDRRGVNIVTVEIATNPGAAGGWSGQRAINFSFDNFKANTDYAILGFLVDTRCAAVGIRGPDSSNLRWGGPAEPSIRDVTCDWFSRLTENFQMPMIPVFNSANKATTNIDVAQNQAAAAVTVSLNIVELAPGS